MKKRIISSILFLSMVLGCLTIYNDIGYAEIKCTYGKIPIYTRHNGVESNIDVMIKDGNLYVHAESLESKMGVTIGYTDESIQILCQDTSGNNFCERNTLYNYEYNTKNVWAQEIGSKDMIEYTLPFEVVKNDKGTWLPFQFVFKVMGSETIIMDGKVHISKANDSIENILIRCLEQIDEPYNELNTVLQERGYVRGGYGLFMNLCKNYPKSFCVIKNEAISRIKDIAYDARNKGNKEKGYEEFAKYLLSNISDEHNIIATNYEEYIGTYIQNRSFVKRLKKILDDAIYQSGKTLKEDSTKKIVLDDLDIIRRSNSDTLLMNNEFCNVYKVLYGYDIKERKWGEGAEIKLFNAFCNSYSGDESNISSLLGGVKGNFYLLMLNISNLNAEDVYISNIFRKYYSNKLYSSNDDLIKLHNEIKKYSESYSKEMLNNINKIKDQIACEMAFSKITDEAKLDSFNRFATSLINKDLVFDLAELPEKITEVIDYINGERHREYLRNNADMFIPALELAKEIGRDIKSNSGDKDLAYAYFRTEYLANRFIIDCLDNNYTKRKLGGNADKIEKELETQNEKFLYNMTILRMGIDYGLKQADNEDYLKKYNDGKIIRLVNNKTDARGITNGNLNACGLMTSDEKYIYYCNMNTDYKLYRENKITQDKECILKDWCHWINIYEENNMRYIFYINKEGSICRVNLKNNKNGR